MWRHGWRPSFIPSQIFCEQEFFFFTFKIGRASTYIPKWAARQGLSCLWELSLSNLFAAWKIKKLFFETNHQRLTGIQCLDKLHPFPVCPLTLLNRTHCINILWGGEGNYRDFHHPEISENNVSFSLVLNCCLNVFWPTVCVCMWGNQSSDCASFDNWEDVSFQGGSAAVSFFNPWCRCCSLLTCLLSAVHLAPPAAFLTERWCQYSAWHGLPSLLSVTVPPV